MGPSIYGELASWYRLLDPTADHEDEAAVYHAALSRTASPPPQTLLELGSGAGNNAHFLARHFRCTLTDLSPSMLELSRELNPECEHLVGDMRSLRLDRQFDSVLVHDAVMYITSLEDLRAVAGTAFLHTRPGGSALFAPDCVRETFAEQSNLICGEDGARAMRCVEWSWDPDPADTAFVTEFAFLLREGALVRALHERHVEGLFPRAAWLEVLAGAGYGVEMVERPIGEGQTDEVFLCRRGG